MCTVYFEQIHPLYYSSSIPLTPAFPLAPFAKCLVGFLGFEYSGKAGDKRGQTQGNFAR
jgi:hypothetical protein